MSKQKIMARFIEFLTNHWELASLWMALLLTLLLYIKSKQAPKLSPQEATMLINRGDGVFLDIRARKEYEKGHIVDAINIPLAKIEERAVELERYKQKTIVVVCNMGQTSGQVVAQLRARGFVSVVNLAGGMSEWNSRGLPIVK
jgi:rhodanese-related sulfurtransferase